jgi:sarcosine oxidase
VPHELGSSHGISRIIRLAYAEHPKYVPLLRRAYQLWRELETKVNERLLFVTGGVDAGDENSDTIRGALSSCNLYDLPHEQLDSASLRRRFPGYRLGTEMVAVYQPDAGFLLPERCVVAHVMDAQDLGAVVHARERVIGIEEIGDKVSVSTNRARYQAWNMIVTAGPWTSTIIPTLKNLAIPERQVLIWTQPRRPEYFRLGAFPVFNMESPEGRFYGFPVYGVPGFKLGKYHHRFERVDDLNQMDRDCHLEDEELLRIGIRRYFPDADGPTMGMKTCLFTNSPDEHFIIDRIASSSRIWVAAGFSGHGFKFCSVVGEIMAELTVEGRTRLDIEMFCINRPAITQFSH